VTPRTNTASEIRPERTFDTSLVGGPVTSHRFHSTHRPAAGGRLRSIYSNAGPQARSAFGVDRGYQSRHTEARRGRTLA
jgi:hypothetical protein